MHHGIRIFTLVLSVILSACGGSGGGGTSACSTLKVNGGESCDDGASPVVYIESGKGNTGMACTGTVISSTSILTAAHCVMGQPSHIHVENSKVLRAASAYYIHPGYRGGRSAFDLAIVKVAEPMPIGPVPLLVSQAAPSPGAELVAYGYGADESGRGAVGRVDAGEAPLKATYLTFASATNGYFYETVTDGAGNLCKGDSGGPILAKNSDGAWGIIAVTSFSPLVSESRPCVPVAPGAISVVSPTQNNIAMAFILAHAPDAALN
jgi:hypothetical protein